MEQTIQELVGVVKELRNDVNILKEQVSLNNRTKNLRISDIKMGERLKNVLAKTDMIYAYELASHTRKWYDELWQMGRKSMEELDSIMEMLELDYEDDKQL